MIKIEKDLFYLAGVIAGDGHLNKGVKWKGKDESKDYGIIITSKDEEFLKVVLNLIKTKINTKTEIKPGKRSNYISIRNKELHNIMNKWFEIPTGKKSDILFIPKKIKNSEYLMHFLAGLFDTDGGLRRGSIGFCSASKQLMEDVSVCLSKTDIENSKDSWINKKYNKEYYGLRIKKSKIQRFIETIPLKNYNKLIKITNRCGSAGAVKRARDLK
jgi:hypothetical protein